MKQTAKIFFVLGIFCQISGMDLITSIKLKPKTERAASEAPIGFFDEQMYLSKLNAQEKQLFQESFILLREGYINEGADHLNGLIASHSKSAVILGHKHRALIALKQANKSLFYYHIDQIKEIHDPLVHKMLALAGDKNEEVKAQATYQVGLQVYKFFGHQNLNFGNVDFNQQGTVSYPFKKINLKNELAKLSLIDQKKWPKHIDLLMRIRMNENELSTIELTKSEEAAFVQIFKRMSPEYLIEKKPQIISRLSQNNKAASLTRNVCKALLTKMKPNENLLAFKLLNTLDDDFFKDFKNYDELLDCVSQKQSLGAAKLLEQIRENSIEKFEKNQKEKIKKVFDFLEKNNNGAAFSTHFLSQCYQEGWAGICNKDISKAKVFAKKAMHDSVDAMEYYLSGQSNLFDERGCKELIESVIKDAAAPLNITINLAEFLINKLNKSEFLIREEEINSIENVIKKIEKKSGNDLAKTGDLKKKLGVALYKNKNYVKALNCLAEAYEKFGDLEAGSEFVALYSMYPERITDQMFTKKATEIIQMLLDAQNLQCALSLGTLSKVHKISLNEVTRNKIEQILKKQFCNNPFEIAPILYFVNKDDQLREFFVEHIPLIKNITQDEKHYLWGLLFVNQQKWFVAKQEFREIKDPNLAAAQNFGLAQAGSHLSLKMEKYDEAIKLIELNWLNESFDDKSQLSNILKKTCIHDCLRFLNVLAFRDVEAQTRNHAIALYFDIVQSIHQKLDILNQDIMVHCATHFLASLIQAKSFESDANLLKKQCITMKKLLPKSFIEADDKNHCLARCAAFEIEEKCNNDNNVSLNDLKKSLKDFNSKTDSIISSERYGWIDNFRTNLIRKIKKMINANEGSKNKEYFQILYENAQRSKKTSWIWSEFIFTYNGSRVPEHANLMKDALWAAFRKNDQDKFMIAESYLEGKQWRAIDEDCEREEYLQFEKDEGRGRKLLIDLINNGSEEYAARAIKKLADHFYKKGKWEQALSYYKAIINSDLRNGLKVGFCNWHLKNYDLAAAYLEGQEERIKEKASSNSMYVEFATKLSEYHQAIKNCSSLERAEAFAQLADIYKNEKNETKAFLNLQKFFFEFEKLSLDDYKQRAVDFCQTYFVKNKLEDAMISSAPNNKLAQLCKYQYLLFGNRSGISKKDDNKLEQIAQLIMKLATDQENDLNQIRVPSYLTLINEALNEKKLVSISELFGELSCLVQDQKIDEYLATLIQLMSTWSATLIHHEWKENAISKNEAGVLLKNVVNGVNNVNKLLLVDMPIVGEVAHLCNFKT